MFIIRQAKVEDVPTLLKLAKMVHFINLPADSDLLAAKIRKGSFDLEDYRAQLGQVSKMGDLSGLMGMLPGVAKVKAQLKDANLDTGIIRRQAAIIGSMTPEERRRPEIIKASRKRRIAAGSGVKVEEVNRLLRQFEDVSSMMKRMEKLGQKGLMRGGLGALLPGNRRPF